jgi:hypothetical protein
MSRDLEMEMIKVNLYYLDEGELCEFFINSLFIKRDFQEHIVLIL